MTHTEGTVEGMNRRRVLPTKRETKIALQRVRMRMHYDKTNQKPYTDPVMVCMDHMSFAPCRQCCGQVVGTYSTKEEDIQAVAEYQEWIT
jgi:hypothetical protein